MSRAGTPAVPAEAEGGCPMSPLRMALDQLVDEEKTIKTQRQTPEEKRPPTPRNSTANNNNAAASSTSGASMFGQVNYGHANMQSFMDPGYAHGKLDGAKTPPYQVAKKQQHRLQQQKKVETLDPPPHNTSPPEKPLSNQQKSPPPVSPPRPQEPVNSPGRNGSIPQRHQSPPPQNLSPVHEAPREKLITHEHIAPPRRVQTTDSSTNTSNDHVPHSSACVVL